MEEALPYTSSLGYKIELLKETYKRKIALDGIIMVVATTQTKLTAFIFLNVVHNKIK